MNAYSGGYGKSGTKESPDQKIIKICIRRQERMEQEKQLWVAQWREIAYRYAPYEVRYFYGGILGAGTTLDQMLFTSGIRQDQFQFDSSPSNALEKYASAIMYYTMPNSQKWHSITPTDQRLKNNFAVKRYCEEVTNTLFDFRYSGNSTFEAQVHGAFMSNGLYGHGYIFIEDRLSKGIGYQAIHMSEAFPVMDAYGQMMGFHRRYDLTAEQAADKWGVDKLPQKIKDCLGDPQKQNKTFKFVHCVYKNEAQQRGRMDAAGMPFASYDINIDERFMVEKGGFRTWPYALTRHISLPGQTFSPSPAFISLADTKTLNEMVKGNLLYAQMTNTPPIMMADVDSLLPFSVRPNALNSGYLSEEGKPMAAPFLIQGDPRFAIDLMQRVENSIKNNFYNTLFDILVQLPEMTATQALMRAQEKGALLAPVIGRQRAEFANVIVVRELTILNDTGLLPPPPDELMQLGGGVQITYSSPLTKAQKAEEGAGILRTFDAAQAFAAHDPTVMRKLNLPQAIETLAEVYSCPPSLIRSIEEWQELVQQDQQQMQAAQMAALAEQGSKAVSNLANAGRASRTNATAKAA